MDEKTLARQMIEASEKTQKAMDSLAKTVLDRDDHIESLRKEVRDLSDILIGEKGDNGLTTRVLFLEKKQGFVSLSSIGVIIALLLTALGLYIK